VLLTLSNIVSVNECDVTWLAGVLTADLSLEFLNICWCQIALFRYHPAFG